MGADCVGVTGSGDHRCYVGGTQGHTVCAHVAYWDDPEQVIWVDLTFPDGRSRRLQGFDNYWLDGDRYGVWQDPDNIGSMYSVDSLHACAWQWDHGEIEVAPVVPPSARVWRGFMLTDEQARYVGLI